MTDNEFIVPTSNKTATFSRPHIRPGLYAARLVDVKMKDKDGKLFEKTSSKFKSATNYAILEFAIHKVLGEDANSMSIGEPVQVKIDHGTQEVTLSQFVNWRYIKTDEKGVVSYSSGLTPGKDGKGSMATKTFQALGWGGPDGGSLDMRSFIGKWAGAIVVDYTNQQNETFSVIQNLVLWKGATPQDATGTPSVVEENVSVAKSAPRSEEIAYESKVAELATLHKQGIITDAGYATALENIKKQYGI